MPAKKWYSRARLPSCQFHISPGWRGGRLIPVSAARIGPRLVTRRSTSSIRPGSSCSIRLMMPQDSVRQRAIRQRISGCSATGNSDASCAQYSISSRRSGPAPRRAPATLLPWAAIWSRISRG